MHLFANSCLRKIHVDSCSVFKVSECTLNILMKILNWSLNWSWLTTKVSWGSEFWSHMSSMCIWPLKLTNLFLVKLNLLQIFLFSLGHAQWQLEGYKRHFLLMQHYPFLQWHLDATLRNTEECLSINRVDEGFLPFLSWLTSTRMIPSTPSHQQASFHLSMRQTIMSEAETHIAPSLPLCPLYTCCFFSVHLTSLINTHTPYTALPPHTSPLFSLPMRDLSNLADCTPWAYSAESNASLFLFGSHSSAPVRSHSHLACLLEMGLSGIPSLPFRNGVIENGPARANKKKKKEEKCHAATSPYSHPAFWYMNETQQVLFQGVVYLENHI